MKQKLQTNLPVIREVRDDQFDLLIARGILQPGSRRFRMGKCTIIVSPPVPEANMGWHISISTPERYPTWDEVAKAWYELIPNSESREGRMILPRMDEYVNLHNFCFHVHEEVSDAHDF